MPFEIDPIYVIYLFVALAGGAVRRRRLSAVLQHAVVPQEHQPPAAAHGRTSPIAKTCWCSLRRERGLDQRRRLPAAAGRAQPADPAIRADHRHRQVRDLSSCVCALFAFGAGDGHARRPAAKRSARRCSAARCCRCWCSSSCAAGGRRSSARSSPTRSTSSCAACAPAIRCRSPSPWWRARWPIRSAASSASSPTRSPTAPISKPACAISISASARTTCRCSSPRWRSRARPAAISAKSWKTSPRSSASASRCGARSARWRPKAAPRR